jgi:hypothetical protein
MAAALTARQRREEARAIASRDVALARELRIGRPVESCGMIMIRTRAETRSAAA